MNVQQTTSDRIKEISKTLGKWFLKAAMTVAYSFFKTGYLALKVTSQVTGNVCTFLDQRYKSIYSLVEPNVQQLKEIDNNKKKREPSTEDNSSQEERDTKKQQDHGNQEEEEDEENLSNKI
jgi:ABC-type Zn2+ transport system substrate-binding protein/surface adhesin